MRHNSIVGRCKRRFRRTTIADPDAATTAVDLVKRSFVPDANEIDRLWCSDVTYIRTWEGWLCLATVIDVASRRVVGWAMADHMRTELVCDALRMAIHHRRPAPGLILHSDRGSQYTSTVFGDLLDANGIRQSLSRPGQCWDNAVAESFFATLKIELVVSKMGFTAPAKDYAESKNIGLVELRRPVDSDWDGYIREVRVMIEMDRTELRG